MNVLYVSSGLDPRTGGTATAAVSVALAATRAGLAATLAVPVEAGTEDLVAPSIATLRAAGVRVETFPFATMPGILDKALNRRAVRWAVSPALGEWLAGHARAYDVIHAHSVWVWSTVQATRAARKANRPVVVMPHEGLTRFDMERAGSPPMRLAKRLLRRFYLSRVDRFVFSSDLERLDSRFDGDPKGVVAAHPVMDETDPPPPPGARRPGPLRVGFLGRFHAKKNLRLLIDGVAAAGDAELIVGGEGTPEQGAMLRAHAKRRGLTDRVHWVGFVPAARRAEFYRSVDLIAMPSAFECFGLVAAEAMAHGTPVLVSPTVGVAATIDAAECGMVVPPRGDAIAAALRRIATDDSLALWAPRAQATALAEYSLAAHGQRLAEVYASVARG